MSNYSAIKVTLTTTNNKVHYSNFDINVKITLKDAPFGADYTENLTCYIYAEDYYPMCNSKEYSLLDFKWPTWTACISTCHVKGEQQSAD